MTCLDGLGILVEIRRSCAVLNCTRHDGWYGKVELQRPKRTIGASKDDEQLPLGQQLTE